MLKSRHPGVHAKNQSLRAEIRDQSLIMGRGGGLQNGKITGLKLIAHLLYGVQLLNDLPPAVFLMGENFLHPQAAALNYPITFSDPLLHLSAWLKMPPSPIPPYCRGKTCPLSFCSPPLPSPLLMTGPL